MAPISCESRDQFEALLNDNADKLIVVDFYADWCGPCRAIAPLFIELSGEHTDAVFLKVNVDNNPDIAQKYGVTAMPTFVLIKNGGKLDDVVGADPGKLKEKITKNK